MTTYNGRCHCGQAEWTIKLDDASHALCHCNACKLLGGGGYSLNVVANKSDLKITKGDIKTYTYHGDSGNPVHCTYCPTCTSHPYHHQTAMGPDKIVIRTVFLEGYQGFGVAAELYVKDRFGWQKPVEGAVAFEGAPPS